MILKYHDVIPNSGCISYHTPYRDEDSPSLHWLDLSIDDAILRIHANEGNITVGIISREEIDYEQTKRKHLFPKEP